MLEFTLSVMILAFVGILIKPLRKINIGKDYQFDKERTNSLRGVLAILIILHHLSTKIDIPQLSFFYDFGAPIVSVFFFLSGYGLSKSYTKKGSLYLKNFLTNRMSKILPLYIVGSLFMGIVILASSGNMGGIALIINKIKLGMGTLPYSWFILSIMLSYVAFYISAKIQKSNSRIAIAMILYCIAYTLLTYMIGFASYWYISIFAIPAGYIIANYEKYLNLNHWGLIALMVVFILSYISIMLIAKVNALYIVYNVLASTSVYVSIRLAGFWKGTILQLLGKISLEIYLLHGIFIYFISPLPWNPYASLFTIVIGTVISAWLWNNMIYFVANKNFIKHQT